MTTLPRIIRSVRVGPFDREPINPCSGVFATFTETILAAPHSMRRAQTSTHLTVPASRTIEIHGIAWCAEASAHSDPRP